MKSNNLTAGEIASRIGARLVGDASLRIKGVASFDSAGEGEMTFAGAPSYLKRVGRCRASAIIVPNGFTHQGKTLLQVENPLPAFIEVIGLFHPIKKYKPGLSRWAVVSSDAVIGKEVTIYPLAFVGRGVNIGDRTVIFPGCIIMDGCRIGADCILYPNCVIYEKCIIGNRVIIHGGTIVGSDGFGFYRDASGQNKIPQVGIVEIEDDVEIGANCAIDRATLGKTLIKKGTKIDNLVQVAHNVSVGERCIIVSQVGISGSTEVGNDVILAGQVGIVDHLRIGNNVVVGAQSGVARDIADSRRVSGSPAIDHNLWLKYVTLLPRLPELRNRITELEKEVARLKKKA